MGINMRRLTFSNASATPAFATLMALASLGAAVNPATAQQARLEGAWNGSGRVMLQSGQSERARCRATIRRQTARTFGMSAVCATSSLRVSQVASLQQVTSNSYAGRFYNAEYNISGAIRMTLRGKRLSASLNGGGGSATFVLSR